MKLPLIGSCVRNAVQFQINAEPLFTHACHCLNCQKITGSAFAMSSFVVDDDLELLACDPISIEQPTKSGSRKVFLCPLCQTVVWAESSDHASIRIIRAGVFLSKQDIQPQAHIWAQRKQGWLELDENTPTFEEDYVRSETWPASSLSRIGG